MDARVFVSYRREDAAGHAGRLYDALVARFGERDVLMDVALAPGVDFVDQIVAAVGACDVLLVVIGPRWARQPDGAGLERTDFVWLEVETGLRHPGVRVIPLLVAGARMPAPEDLPEAVQALARRNALVLDDMGWRQDVQRLMATLAEALEGPPPSPARRRPRRLAAAVVVVAVALLAAGLAYALRGRDGEPSLIPGGHRLVVQRSLLVGARRYTLAVSVPKGATSVAPTLSLFAAPGTQPRQLVERKPLPDRYRFTGNAYVNDFRLAANPDGSANASLSWFNSPGDTASEVSCTLDIGVTQIADVSCS